VGAGGDDQLVGVEVALVLVRQMLDGDGLGLADDGRASASSMASMFLDLPWKLGPANGASGSPDQRLRSSKVPPT